MPEDGESEATVEPQDGEVTESASPDRTAREPSPDRTVQEQSPDRTAQEQSPDRTGDGRADRAADTFLDLEDELATAETAADVGDERISGLIVGAGTVPAEAVPDSYPLAVTTDEALAFNLDVGDREATTYLEWPGDDGVDPESSLGRLLAAVDVSAAEFADLYGRTLLLDRETGHYTVYVPSEPPRGSGDWALGVVGAFAFNLAFLAATALSLVSTPVAMTVFAFVAVNWALLPYAVYSDATYLRTHSDWGQGPAFWATLSMLPWLNLLVIPAYLWSRSRARFLGSEPSLTARLTRRLRGFLP